MHVACDAMDIAFVQGGRVICRGPPSSSIFLLSMHLCWHVKQQVLNPNLNSYLLTVTLAVDTPCSGGPGVADPETHCVHEDGGVSG